VTFACLDFIAKGLYVLTLLCYKLTLYRQNGLLVSAFRRIVKVHPIPEEAKKVPTSEMPTLTDDVYSLPKIKPSSQIVLLEPDEYPDFVNISPLPTMANESVAAV
jgi:hypothetical protein